MRWGALPYDYLFFRFFELSKSQRSTYVTSGLSRKLRAKYSNVQFTHFFRDKVLFATKFGEFFGRDWVSLEGLGFDTFGKFIAGKRYIIIRIITVLQNGNCNILHAALTLGNGREISNAACGDMVAPINLASGEIEFPAQDETGRIYYEHPMTGHTIAGFKIPYWDDIIKLIDQASRVVPEIGYVGWDVGVTPEGPILIEGNFAPGHWFQQLPAHLPGKIGNRAVYERFL